MGFWPAFCLFLPFPLPSTKEICMYSNSDRPINGLVHFLMLKPNDTIVYINQNHFCFYDLEEKFQRLSHFPLSMTRKCKEVFPVYYPESVAQYSLSKLVNVYSSSNGKSWSSPSLCMDTKYNNYSFEKCWEKTPT